MTATPITAADAQTRIDRATGLIARRGGKKFSDKWGTGYSVTLGRYSFKVESSVYHTSFSVRDEDADGLMVSIVRINDDRTAEFVCDPSDCRATDARMVLQGVVPA